MTFGTTLAALVSVVFFAQLLGPAGMPSAMMGIELATLHANTARGANDSDGANWTTIYSHLRKQAARQPTTRPRVALSQLLEMVIEVDRGQRSAADEAEHASRLVEQIHPANLAARLGYAMIQMAAREDAKATDDAAGFDLLRQSLIEPSTGWKPTLYNRELTTLWYEILSSRLRRKDVAAAATSFYEHYEIREHYRALPIIHREIDHLAETLDVQGRHDDARQCRRWFVQMAVGLMRSETEAGTRLLCADLLARMSGIEPDAAKAMSRLRADFHAAADAAPVDLTDPMRTPSVVPRHYRAAVRSMIAAASFGLAGIGGAILLALVVLAAVIRYLTGNHLLKSPETSSSPAPAPQRSLVARISAILIAALAPTALLLVQVEVHGLYSEKWLYVAAVTVMSSSASLVLVFERYFFRRKARALPDQFRKGRAAVAVMHLLAFATLSPLLLPQTSVAWIVRWLDPLLPGALAIAIVLMLVLFAILVMSGLPLRRAATIAAMQWCICAAIGLAALQYHRAQAGEHYQQAVAAGRMDEVAARLGDDWQRRYLDPVIHAYNK